MTTATNPLKNRFDDADPNKLADLFRTIALGKVLRQQLPQVLRKQVGALDSSQLGTLHGTGVVAKGVPAASILRARAWRGTATPVELAVKLYGVTPSTGEIAVAPNGEIVVLAADAWLDFDVTYMPERGEVITLPELPVTTGVLTLPSNVLDASSTRKSLLLLSAEATEGSVIGDKIILIPAGTALSSSLPATTKAQLSLDGKIVQFNNSTDAVTAAIVSLLVIADDDLDTLLESEATF